MQPIVFKALTALLAVSFCCSDFKILAASNLFCGATIKRLGIKPIRFPVLSVAVLILIQISSKAFSLKLALIELDWLPFKVG